MIKKEKNGVIFGITSLLGAKLAKELTRNGVNLILQDDSKANLERIDVELKNIGKQQTYLFCKHQNLENLDKLDNAIQQKFEKLDFLISTIGNIQNLRPLTDLNLNEWQKLIDINLTVNWLFLKKTEKFLRKSSNPKIYFFYNKQISKGKPYYNGYSISKAGLESMINLYKEEKKKFNFSVNIIDIDLDNFCEISHLRPRYSEYNYAKEIKRIVYEILADTN